MHGSYPLRVGVGDHAPGAVNDGRVSFLAKTDLLAQLLDRVRAKFTQEDATQPPGTVPDGLRHQNPRLAADGAQFDARDGPCAHFARLLNAHLGREQVPCAGTDAALGGQKAEFRLWADERDGAKSHRLAGCVLQELLYVMRIGLTAVRRELIAHQPQHAQMVVYIQAHRRGQVDREQAMLFGDFAPGIVPGRMVKLDAQHGERYQRDQHEGDGQQPVDRLREKTGQQRTHGHIGSAITAHGDARIDVSEEIGGARQRWRSAPAPRIVDSSMNTA